LPGVSAAVTKNQVLVKELHDELTNSETELQTNTLIFAESITTQFDKYGTNFSIV